MSYFQITAFAIINLIFSVLLPPSYTYANPISPTLIGQFHDWRAFSAYEDGQKVCFMMSKPTLSEGNYSRRDPVYAFITHRKSDKVYDVVSFISGYQHMEQTDVNVTIDNQKPFQLFTQKNTAWSRNSDTDRKLVNALRMGRKMTVMGTSHRGTATIDHYSLRGTTQAYKTITRACR